MMPSTCKATIARLPSSDSRKDRDVSLSIKPFSVSTAAQYVCFRI